MGSSLVFSDFPALLQAEMTTANKRGISSFFILINLGKVTKILTDFFINFSLPVENGEFIFSQIMSAINRSTS